MASLATCSKPLVAAPQTKAFNGLRPLPAAFSKPTVSANFMAVRQAPKIQRRNSTTVQAMGSMEIMQVANEAGFIAGVAGVMCAMTLVGLAVGFVILRVESLAEEGKI